MTNQTTATSAAIPDLETDRKLSNCNELPAESQDNADGPKNALGHGAAKPFYIWSNEDCANKTDDFKEAKVIRLALFNEGGESVHIVDADGVEVVDEEIKAHEEIATAGYFAGARNPDVKPDFPGAFMVNDPQDSDGFAIVGDDIAALILEARDHLIEPASERELLGNVQSATLDASPQGNEAALKASLLALTQYIERDLENNSPEWKPEDIPEYANAKALLGQVNGSVLNSIEPLPSQARGHTAYEATVEDVENVLRSNSLAVANTKGKSFESMANELHGDLDFDLIEQAALAGDDLDEQTDYANDEIACWRRPKTEPLLRVVPTQN